MTTPSSKKWLQRQRKDIFVKQAKKEGIRSRAVFKLREIQEKYKLITPAMKILELGAAPGSWTEEIKKYVSDKGHIYAVDRLAMDPIDSVTIHQCDIESEEFNIWLEKTVAMQGLDIVLSDMAPNMCGHQQTDQLRATRLCELALDVSCKCLKNNGCLVMKAFQGIGFNELLKQLRAVFQKVNAFKPKASERSATEIYLIAQGFDRSKTEI